MELLLARRKLADEVFMLGTSNPGEIVNPRSSLILCPALRRGLSFKKYVAKNGTKTIDRRRDVLTWRGLLLWLLDHT